MTHIFSLHRMTYRYQVKEYLKEVKKYKKAYRRGILTCHELTAARIQSMGFYSQVYYRYHELMKQFQK